MFNGFADETTEFLWGIRLNNEKSWFEAHRQQYVQYVQQPLKELGKQAFLTLQEEHPDIPFTLHVCRIYRDARRLFGRGPYKSHLWFTVFSGDKDKGGPAFWFEISPEGYGCGMGTFPPSPALMARFRKDIDNNPAEMLKLARKFEKQERFAMMAEEYKRPKGTPPGELLGWYNRKYIDLCWQKAPDRLFCSAELAQEVSDSFRELYPYFRYFDKVFHQGE